MTFPQVTFKVRYPVPGNQYRFERVDIHGPGGAGHCPVEHPPLAGDLIILPAARAGEPDLEGGPVFRVIDRMWVHSEYGSPNWPYGKMSPVAGPLLEIIVEPAEGLYAREAPLQSEGEED